jgi:mono/diheme cytochrome c family protein
LRAALAVVVACIFAGAVALAACDDDAGASDAGPEPAPRADRGSGSRLDGAIAFNVVRFHAPSAAPDASAVGDAGSADAGLDAQGMVRARGAYLVRHVAGCMECHTPRLPSGAFDEHELLSGVEGFADLEPGDDSRGLIHTRNLTPDGKTGLGHWSDEQIKRAFQHGLDDESQVLHWMMPYWIFASMHDDDADAIVAYLRSIPAVVHSVPANQPNAVDMRKPYVAYVLPEDAIPRSTLALDDPARASADRGRYLASGVAPCMLCHSPPQPDDGAMPLDPARAFSGRRKLLAVKFGAGVQEAPLIETFNLTPHVNGIGTWTAIDVANVLRAGVAPTGLPTCDPMPSYFGGSFRGMNEQDAHDLGSYFTTIPAQDSGVIPACCSACHGDMMMDGDGDAG